VRVVIDQSANLWAETGDSQSEAHRHADWLAMKRTTLTRNLKLLEKDGLIETRAGVHHCSRVSGLTASGKAKLLLAEARSRMRHYLKTDLNWRPRWPENHA
jgi:DNA-binding MarR family transcriptional regulator